MPTTIFSNRTLLVTYEYDQTATAFSGTWDGFTLVTTQINGSIPPIAGAEIVLYYLVSTINLGSTIPTYDVEYSSNAPINENTGYSGQIKFTLAGGASTTTSNSYTVNGANTTTTQNGLTSYQWTCPVAGSYLYVWLSHDYCGQPCSLTVTATPISSGSGSNWSGSGDTLSDGCATITANSSTCCIGIDQTNPQYTLDVAGDINFTGTLYQGGSPFSLSTGNWVFSGDSMTDNTVVIQNQQNGNGTGYDLFYISVGTSANTYLQLYDNSAGPNNSIGAYFNINSVGGFGVEQSVGGFFTVTNNQPIILTSNGSVYVSGTHPYVGINNSSPAYSLDVGGNINASGTILTTGYQIYDSGLGRNVTITSLNGIIQVN